MARRSTAKTKEKPEPKGFMAATAKEINVRLQKAARMEGQIGGHVVAASIQLAEVQLKCKKQRIPFKKWVEENITELKYETVRKYAVIGRSDNPHEAYLEWRQKGTEAMRALRASKAPRTIEDQTPEGRRRRRRQIEIATERYHRLPEKQKPEYLRNIVEEDPGKSIETMQQMFKGLKPMQQISFGKWCAERLGLDWPEG